eukprot:511315-Amphidinium_carterae.1
MVNEEPITKEPETVPETPSAPAQMKPPPVPTATPASSSGHRPLPNGTLGELELKPLQNGR